MIVMMCTGNICRSPMAEALLRRRVEELGVPVQVRSAGLLLADQPADYYAVDAMNRLGLDITRHRSRLIDPAIVAEADLVIGMEARHVREASMLDPDAFDRTFTLPDLVTRAEAAGPRGTEPFADWVARVGEGRSRASALRGGPAMEISDPVGGSKRVFRKCADQLADLIDRFTVVAWSDELANRAHDPARRPSPRSL